MPLDPEVERRSTLPPRQLTGKQAAWLLFLRLACTTMFFYVGWSIVVSDMSLFAKIVAALLVFVVGKGFAKDNVSDPR